ncbi:MAG: HemK family protein methyltransferase [Deferribacterota bacterium]|nr:HemK family protein methyltransferase [Deferribacterota bacterium]
MDIDYSKVYLSFSSKIILNKKIIKEIELLRKGYPLAYITKRKVFYKYEFYIDERVLIPREDTSVLIDYIIKSCSYIKEPKILDLCTGSANILISLILEFKRGFGVGIDNSLQALEVARINSHKFALNNRVDLLCADVFNVCDILKGKIFDIIVCNPPYVGLMESDYEDSIKYEPRRAIFAEEKGFIFYKKLLPIVNKLCKRDGFIIFEINPNLYDKIVKLCEDLSLTFVTIYDLENRPRAICWKNCL